MNTNHFGTLYIVATPLGNLQDMSLRAISILKNVDYIASEDTRHSLPLLQHFSINKPLISMHEHNERARSEQLLERLKNGSSIALISDAGTPLISDPGSHLVSIVRSEGISVVPIPGPCAAIAALSASGLPTDRFVFEGFLDTKGKLRKDRIAALQSDTRTIIFYESPRRILALLEDLEKTFGGEREAVYAKELTKIFETFHAGTLTELIQWVKEDPNRERGEIVLLVKGAPEISAENKMDVDFILKVLLEKLSLKEAVEIAMKITKTKKNIVYQKALVLKK